MGWLFNPFTGELNPTSTQQSSGPAESAVKLKASYVASQEISALKVIRLINETSCALCDVNSYEEARATGVALNAAIAGGLVEVQTFGILEDASFTFPLYAPLFINPFGVITDQSNQTFLTQIGHSLGNGAIFINVKEPIQQGI